MRQIPILFSTPMVQAILEGRKTQTRRISKLEKINKRPNHWYFDRILNGMFGFRAKDEMSKGELSCPYGKVGDVLWVRETFRPVFNYGVDYPIYQYKDLQFSAAWCNGESREMFIEQSIIEDKWTPSIHMPKEAARIWLEVVKVRVERLQDISEEDAIAEGAPALPNGLPADMSYPKDYKGGFEHIWRVINGKESWELNPWVWVVEFKRIEKPAEKLKVFKITCDQLVYGISAPTKDEAILYLQDFTDEEPTECVEIAETEWDKPFIEASDLDGVSGFFLSIRAAIETGVTQIIFTNDADLIEE